METMANNKNYDYFFLLVIILALLFFFFYRRKEHLIIPCNPGEICPDGQRCFGNMCP